MSCLRKQSTGDVSVEVNACPGPDLRQILEDLRCQYETLIARNRKEVEDWYECKVRDTPVLQTRLTHTAPGPGAFQRPDMIPEISSSAFPVKPESSTHYTQCSTGATGLSDQFVMSHLEQQHLPQGFVVCCWSRDIPYLD